jgi:integrase
MIVKAVMNWAVSEGYLDASPLAKLRRRKIARRGRILSPDERGRILAAVSPAFRDFLRVLEQTGFRPFSEVARLAAADVDFGQGRAVLKKHKNAGKGKQRVIYFPAALLTRLAELAAERPTGPLLRNRLGNKWTPSNVGHYLERVEVGLEPFVCYDFRHSYVTDALTKGVPVEVVAELVGTSARVIHAQYGEHRQEGRRAPRRGGAGCVMRVGAGKLR